MTVTKIEAVTKTRYRVYLDEQFAFVLNKSELSRYHVTVGEVITQELYEEVKRDIVKKAKLRALHLLNEMGRTETQLYNKLRQSGYTDDVVEEAVQYVKSFGYVNDHEYAYSFITNRKNKKSRRELYIQLSQKGISLEVLDNVFEECYSDYSAEEAIYNIMKKKKYDPQTATKADTQKILTYLTRKGFLYEDIRRVLQVSELNA